MANYIIPVIFVTIFVYAIIKKIPLYSCFTDGIKSALHLIADIFPFITAIFIAVELLNVSGISDLLTNWLAPVFGFFGIPKELTKLMILRPLSGNGSLAILDEIYLLYGVDSYIARCGSIIAGAAETIFYITAVYFSTSKITKLRYAIPVSLFSTVIGAIVGCLLCRII